jgi:hypothetical protein
MHAIYYGPYVDAAKLTRDLQVGGCAKYKPEDLADRVLDRKHSADAPSEVYADAYVIILKCERYGSAGNTSLMMTDVFQPMEPDSEEHFYHHYNEARGEGRFLDNRYMTDENFSMKSRSLDISLFQAAQLCILGCSMVERSIENGMPVARIFGLHAFRDFLFGVIKYHICHKLTISITNQELAPIVKVLKTLKPGSCNDLPRAEVKEKVERHLVERDERLSEEAHCVYPYEKWTSVHLRDGVRQKPSFNIRTDYYALFWEGMSADIVAQIENMPLTTPARLQRMLHIVTILIREGGLLALLPAAARIVKNIEVNTLGNFPAKQLAILGRDLLEIRALSVSTEHIASIDAVFPKLIRKLRRVVIEKKTKNAKMLTGSVFDEFLAIEAQVCSIYPNLSKWAVDWRILDFPSEISQFFL